MSDFLLAEILEELKAIRSALETTPEEPRSLVLDPGRQIITDGDGNVISDSEPDKPLPEGFDKPRPKRGPGRPRKPSALDELKELAVDSPPLNEKGLAE